MSLKCEFFLSCNSQTKDRHCDKLDVVACATREDLFLLDVYTEMVASSSR